MTHAPSPDELRRFAEAYETAPLPLALISADGVIVEPNGAFEAALGYEKGELIGRHIGVVLAEGQLAALAGLRREEFRRRPGPRFGHGAGGEAGVLTMQIVRLRHRDGRVLEAEVSSHEIRDAQGEVTHFVTRALFRH